MGLTEVRTGRQLWRHTLGQGATATLERLTENTHGAPRCDTSTRRFASPTGPGGRGTAVAVFLFFPRGSGANILNRMVVSDGARVGMGAVVTKPVAPHTTVVGVPAKPLVK